MNRKDCENIGLHLAYCREREELMENLFAMDPRIKEMYESFLEVRGDDEATQKRYDQLMTEEYGTDWAWSKRARVEGRQKEFWNQAYKEVRS